MPTWSLEQIHAFADAEQAIVSFGADQRVGSPAAEEIVGAERDVVLEERGSRVDNNPEESFAEQRREYGKLKDEQIKKTGATYCITPCHNCHAQVHDLSEHFEGHYSVVHLWTLICLSLGILGENEREYLGDDLKDVLVFHPETAM